MELIAECEEFFGFLSQFWFAIPVAIRVVLTLSFGITLCFGVLKMLH